MKPLELPFAPVRRRTLSPCPLLPRVRVLLALLLLGGSPLLFTCFASTGQTLAGLTLTPAICADGGDPIKKNTGG